ncbi:MAG: 2-oxo acid dehydrogenase subunit E2, partial [Acidimicrobiales bacterium]
MADAPRNFEDLGPNEWLVDEMYEQYRADPASVSESWQEFFADYRTNGSSADAAPAPVTAPSPTTEAPAPPPAEPAPAKAAPPAVDPDGVAIKGAAARIVTNMEASLAVPTATSFREIPAKLLEVNRRIMNGYLGRTQGGKVSFTHLIGYAVVRAIADEVPAMNASYLEVDGKPRLIRHEHLGLGLAVDVAKDDGSRTLLVPVIKGADKLDFRAFWGAYEDLIRKVRSNKLGPDDFAGATITLTN